MTEDSHIDYSKWQSIMTDFVAFVDNATLVQMIQDLKHEHDKRVTELIGEAE